MSTTTSRRAAPVTFRSASRRCQITWLVLAGVVLAPLVAAATERR